MSMNHTAVQGSSKSYMSAALILGTTIREEREAQGMTIAQVAGYAGCHPSIWALIEAGVWVPDQDEVRSIAGALGVGWVQLSFLAMVADHEIKPRFVQRRRL